MSLVGRPWILVVLVALCAPARAQSLQTEAYARLLRQYPVDPAAAVTALTKLPRQTIELGVGGCLRVKELSLNQLECAPQQLMAAALMHAEAAEIVIEADTDRALFLIDQADRLISPLMPSSRNVVWGRTGDEDQFVPRWSAYVARRQAAHGYVAQASRRLRVAIPRFPKAADLYLARGVIGELQWYWAHPDLRGRLQSPAASNQGLGMANLPLGLSAPGAPSQLEIAADYRRAIDLETADPRFHVWLAWVHLLVGDDRASADLAPALHPRADSRTRYLAHLVSGAIAERRRDVSAAVTAYAAARAIGPAFPTACTALSHAYDALGDADRSRQVALECLALEADVSRADPWWLFRAGVMEEETVEWLQSIARRH